MPSTHRSANTRLAFPTMISPNTMLWVITGIMTLSSSCPASAASATVVSRPSAWKQTWFTISAIEGFTLPGMMLEPGLHRRKQDLGETGARSRGQQPDVVGDLVEIQHVGPERTAEGGDVTHGLHELDPVAGLPQLETAHLLELLHHQSRVLGLGIDARADGGSADVHLAQPVGCLGELLDGAAATVCP